MSAVAVASFFHNDDDSCCRSGLTRRAESASKLGLSDFNLRTNRLTAVGETPHKGLQLRALSLEILAVDSFANVAVRSDQRQRQAASRVVGKQLTVRCRR